jgi:hypothetical protein
MDQQAFERGWQQILASLNAWQALGYESYAACQSHLWEVYSQELAHAQEQASSAQSSERRAYWQRYVVFFQGCLAGLNS